MALALEGHFLSTIGGLVPQSLKPKNSRSVNIFFILIVRLAPKLVLFYSNLLRDLRLQRQLQTAGGGQVPVTSFRSCQLTGLVRFGLRVGKGSM